MGVLSRHIPILATGAASTTPSANDSGTSVETTVIAFSASDTGSLVAENTTVGGDLVQSAADTGSATELGLFIIIDADTGTATAETPTEVNSISDVDIGIGTDEGLFEPQFLSESDSATAIETPLLTPQTILSFGIASKKWYAEDDTKWGYYEQKRWKSRLVTNGDQIS